MSPQYASEVRSVIESALRKLLEDLRQFEKTTHGRIDHWNNDIGPVVYDLGEVYRKPCPYTVSNLSQALTIFLRNLPVPAAEVPQ